MFIELHADQKFKVISGPERLIISGQPRTVVNCLCECGTRFLGRVDHIKQDKYIKSCGCLKERHMRKGGHNRLANGMAAARNVYNSYRSKCLRKGIRFDITFEKFLELSGTRCFYCDAEPFAAYGETFKRGVRAGLKKVNGPYVYNGIDRLQPSGGYVEGNMVPCCTYCNSAKGARSYPDFMEWIQRLVKLYRARE